MERACNDCGSTEWTKLLATSYPERRRDRDQTKKNVYECDSCGAEGRYFEHHDGPDTYSGAFRR